MVRKLLLFERVDETEYVLSFEDMAASEPVRPISDCTAQRQGTVWLRSVRLLRVPDSEYESGFQSCSALVRECGIEIGAMAL
jgi:hypothetical protein